jgi:predicted GNAT family N-acyltransferase
MKEAVLKRQPLFIYICVVKIFTLKILSFKYDNKTFADMALAIRTQVFVEEQKVDPTLEYDQYEKESTHYLMLDEKNPIATARWRETEKGIKLERFAVLSQYRNQGIGGLVLEKVLSDVLLLNKTIYLNSQLKAVPFYERYGFVKSGEPFIEANIEHCRMEYVAK